MRQRGKFVGSTLFICGLDQMGKAHLLKKTYQKLGLLVVLR